jgi:hypothetical protein
LIQNEGFSHGVGPYFQFMPVTEAAIEVAFFIENSKKLPFLFP